MNEMKIKLTNHFITNAISKVIKKGISKNYGVDTDISLERISLDEVNGRIYVGIDGSIDEKSLVELIKKI